MRLARSIYGAVVTSSKTIGKPLIPLIPAYNAFVVDENVLIKLSLFEILGQANGLTNNCSAVVLPVLEAPQRLTIITPVSEMSFNREATTAE